MPKYNGTDVDMDNLWYEMDDDELDDLFDLNFWNEDSNGEYRWFEMSYYHYMPITNQWFVIDEQVDEYDEVMA